MGFQQGLSGLNATSKNLEVIGNNIANASTYGAKASRAEFSDMYASAMNGAGANTIGIGVNLTAVSQQFTQGNIATTQNPMDLAINGAGFFQVSDGKNPTMYTRNGQFKVDRDGFVINSQGNKLMGYAADSVGMILPGRAAPLQMPTGVIPPQATDEISMELNLDSRAAGIVIPAAPAAPVDFADPKTYNNATSLTVYDAKGQDIAVTYYFQKDAAPTPPTPGLDTWNVYVTANGTPLAGTVANPASSATLSFDSLTGVLTSPSPATIVLPAGVVPQAMTMNVGSATQYGSPFAVTDMAQNGYAAGQLVGVQVETNGIVMARYSNGESKPAGQIEIATFRNPQGLQPMGGNAWARSFATGEPVVGVPGDGNLGTLQAGALEESNVDMTAELVNMITAQRIYQANAQTVKTQDQVLQTLVNLR